MDGGDISAGILASLANSLAWVVGAVFVLGLFVGIAIGKWVL